MSMPSSMMAFCSDTNVVFTKALILSRIVPGCAASSSVTQNSFKAEMPSIERKPPGMPCPVQSAVMSTLYFPHFATR